MRNLLLATAFIIGSGSAYATNDHAPTPTTPAASTVTAAGGNGGAGGAGGRGGNARQGQQQRQGQSQGQAVTVNNSTTAGGGYGGGYNARGNTPDVMMPGVSGGHPCGLGGSAGGSVPGIGSALGAMLPGRGCEIREKARLLRNMGFDLAAKNTVCLDADMRYSLSASGQPCPADADAWRKSGLVETTQGWKTRDQMRAAGMVETASGWVRR